MNSESEESLRAEGYGKVEAWDAPAGEADAEHTHDFDTKLHVISGSICIKTGGVDTELKAGESIEIPLGQLHLSVVGPSGCRYLIAERTAT